MGVRHMPTIDGLVKANKLWHPKSCMYGHTWLSNTLGLIDDISTLSSDFWWYFQEISHKIYPSSLILNKENIDDLEADIFF